MALSSFARLNRVVSVHTSSHSHVLTKSEAPRRSAKYSKLTPPDAILLLSWGNAQARHIEKYANMYLKHFPEAKIILVTSGWQDFLYRSEQKQRQLLEPAIKILANMVGESLLVHVMSNGGSKQWCTINTLYRQWMGHPLPHEVIIIDSAPGRSNLKQSWAALSRSLPEGFILKLLLRLVFGVVLFCMLLTSYVRRTVDVLEFVREEMNDNTLFFNTARRCYLYSDTDDIIGWNDVEDHAIDAARKGWVVTSVKFEGSRHVGHIKQDPERYWDTIEKTWFKR